MNKKIYCLALGAVLGGMLVSCTNELNEPNNVPNQPVGIKLVKAPDVYAYSGDKVLTAGTRDLNLHVLNNTRSEEHSYSFWKWDNMASVPQEYRDKYEPHMPDKNTGRTDDVNDEAVSQAEADYVIQWIKTHEGGDVCNLTDYWLQNVGSSFDIYTTENIRNGGNQDTFVGVEKMNQIRLSLQKSGQWNYKFELPDFNGAGKNGSRLLCIDCPIDGTSYQASYGSNEILNAHKFYYITIPNEEIYGKSAGHTYCYIGFDYRDYKFDNGTWDFLNGDGDYSDWVIKLSPADGSDAKDPSQGPKEPDEELCSKGCGHADHGDRPCEECGDDEGCNKKETEIPEVIIPENPDPGFGVTPETPDKTIDHVEINLAIDRKANIEWLAAHLSIHVRAATDVKVFIPLPDQYYCEPDDMEIVMKHEPNHMIHGGPYELEYTLKDSDPELVVKLKIDYEEDGITVTTDGITQDVIDWCAEKCDGDGITFEVWTYINIKAEDWLNKNYNEEIVPELAGYLNQSTVEFLDKLPSLYVNAFNDTAEGKQFGDDCTVTPVEEQKGNFDEPEKGEWFNGSKFNDLYRNNNPSGE